jgi:hypothetical protein
MESKRRSFQINEIEPNKEVNALGVEADETCVYFYGVQLLTASNRRRFQSWGINRTVTTNDDRNVLKKSLQAGTFHETMLDRREKIKSDRYCK